VSEDIQKKVGKKRTKIQEEFMGRKNRYVFEKSVYGREEKNESFMIKMPQLDGNKDGHRQMRRI
jgi:hypothetical protein